MLNLLRPILTSHIYFFPYLLMPYLPDSLYQINIKDINTGYF